MSKEFWKSIINIVGAILAGLLVVAFTPGIQKWMQHDQPGHSDGTISTSGTPTSQTPQLTPQTQTMPQLQSQSQTQQQTQPQTQQQTQPPTQQQTQPPTQQQTLPTTQQQTQPPTQQQTQPPTQQQTQPPTQQQTQPPTQQQTQPPTQQQSQPPTQQQVSSQPPQQVLRSDVQLMAVGPGSLRTGVASTVTVQILSSGGDFISTDNGRPVRGSIVAGTGTITPSATTSGGQAIFSVTANSTGSLAIKFDSDGLSSKTLTFSVIQ